MPDVVLGVDVGTSSTKGVLVDFDGHIIATAVREHAVSRPKPGWVEMDPKVWWEEFASISRELTGPDRNIVAVGTSGMGPCLAVVDENDEVLRPAILYGIDTRAGEQIDRLNQQLGDAEILYRCGSALSTQAVGPKLAWLADNEPDVYERARRFFMPSSWLVRKLTGEYLLDFHSASQCTPMFDTLTESWFEPWASLLAPDLQFPRLVWPGDVAGGISTAASLETGLPSGIPVIAGTIDAWSESISVGAVDPGDLMLMYGTTMFLINTVVARISSPQLWGTVGAFPGTRNLAGGMATSGAITSWLRSIFGFPRYEELLEKAELSGPGANGLLMLPYFAGERTPIADPEARGIIAGLTISHTDGDLYRAALEGTAFGVRHNIESIIQSGGVIERVVAVGGGTQGGLWTQIVSDVTGRDQSIPTVTVGASFGAAFLAARTLHPVSIENWNPTHHVVRPRPEVAELYENLYRMYRGLYLATRDTSHLLAAIQTASACRRLVDTGASLDADL